MSSGASKDNHENALFATPGANAPPDVAPLPPPTGWLIAAAGSLGASLLLLLGGSFADLAHLLGWALASVVTIALLARFTMGDFQRRERPNYQPRPAAGHLRYLLAGTGIVLAALHAWTLAWSLASR